MIRNHSTLWLLHDNNSLVNEVAQVTSEINSGFNSVKQCASLELPNRSQSGDLFVLIANLHTASWIKKVQAYTAEHQINLLSIGVESDHIWFGPYHEANSSGCFYCMTQWLHNNYRDSFHWSNPSNQSDNKVPQQTAPLLPASVKIIQSLLQYFLTSLSKEQHPLTNQVYRLDLRRNRTSRHAFIPLNDCIICSALPADNKESAEIRLSPQAKLTAHSHRVRNDKLDLESLRKRFVDRHTGMIKHVYHSLTSDLMPMFSAELPIRHAADIESGYGRNETKQVSEMVAILETLERYGGHSPKGKKTQVRASYAQVKEWAIDPKKLILHHQTQQQEPGFNLKPYSDDLEFNWVWGHSLKSGKQLLVPEQHVYYYLLNTAQSPVNRFIYDTSNGCALGGSLEEAILYGLLELVERDAYLTTWYGRFSPTEIDLQAIQDERIQALLARSEFQGLKIHAFDIRVGIDLPIIWCMVIDHAEQALVKSYCAAGAHFQPENAIYSALIEVTTSIGVYQKSMPPLKSRAEEMYRDNSKVQSMHDHVLLYSLPETFERLNFLFAKNEMKSIEEIYGSERNYGSHPDLTEDLKELTNKVLQIADDVIVVDQTYPELKEHQLHCVKVIAPGLMPVTFGHQFRRISLERVNQAANTLGVKAFEHESMLNQHPHNFP